MLKYTLLPFVVCAFTCAAHAQTVELSVDQYEQLKAAGALPTDFHVSYSTLPPPHVQPNTGAERANGDCNCWIEPDSTYVLAMEPNDDGSSPGINLPFTFNLYGDMYTTCYVNNNGNVSFLLPHPTYSAFAFPTPSFRMVAPFWADVDTRAAGTVKYKLTPNALYVNWTGVGYYASQADKLNTFQLIISDGTNTDVGIGSTVSFCYKEMTWTTGSASCIWEDGAGYTCSNSLGEFSCSPNDGLEVGFCGTPATVGANRGNGIDYVQFGRFNMPGTAYDGPFGNPDEVGWLSYKNFVFSTAVSSSNIAPVASGSSLCDTVRVCAGDTVRLDVDFLSPEQNQSTTAGYAISPALSVPVNAVNNGPGNTVHLQLEFIPAFSDTGFFMISYTATDNGTPPLSASVAVILQVLPAPSVVPVITGDTVACVGQTVVLSTDDGYPFHEWSNGMTGDAVNVGPGTYTVWAGPASCGLISDSIVVHGIPLPVPVINGVPFLCGDQPAQLSTTEAYAQYLWSNGDTVAAIAADTGSYSVTVTDAFGCSGTSMPVTVSPAPAPTAFFSGLPSGPVAPGTTVVYLDGSTGNGAVITGWHWDAGNLGSGDSTTFTITFPSPGVYPITLTVTTADGCTGTYVLNQTVLPTEVVVPNVFSPNGDGVNDALVFEGIQYLPNTALHVFNRWGQVLFQSGNYKNNWRPSPDIPEGTYFFVLKLEDGRTFTGHVTILR